MTGNTTFKGAIITGAGMSWHCGILVSDLFVQKALWLSEHFDFHIFADFTDVLFREDQRAYLCQIADGYEFISVYYIFFSSTYNS